MALEDKSGNANLQEAARTASKKMKAILDDMKDFSGSLRVKPESLFLDTVIKDAVMEAKIHHSGVQINTVLDEGLMAFADPVALERILANLINNAVEAKSPSVSIEAALNEERDRVIVKIIDRGIGISENIKQKLLKPFSSHGKAEGSGLGLWHGAQLLKAMGGDLGIESHVGHGTVITLELQKGT